MRVFCLLSLLIVAVCIAVAAFTIMEHRRDTKELFREQSLFLANQAGRLLLWDDRVSLRALLVRLVGDQPAIAYAFVEREKQPYVHTFGKGVPKALLALHGAQEGELSLKELENGEGRVFYDIAVAVEGNRDILHIGLSREVIDQHTDANLLMIGVLGTAALVIGALLAGATAVVTNREVDQMTMMGEMATNLAHELNQHLCAISNYSQGCVHRLRSGKGKPNELLDAMKKVSSQARQASEIISRIRSFIQKKEPVQTQVNVNDVIHETLDLLMAEADELGIVIKLELSDSLPPAKADPVQIRQVILNLTRNGIEAMSDNASTPRHLTINTSAGEDDMIEVAIRDTGKGVSTKNLDRVFTPFFTTKANGLGMGLSISRSIINAHGGCLCADRDGEMGTVFHFTLPIANGGSPDGC